MRSEEEIREAFQVLRDYINLINDVPILQIAVGSKSHIAMVGAFACLGWLLGEPPYSPCPVAGTIDVAREDLKSADELRKHSALLTESLEALNAARASSPPKIVH